MPMLLGRVLLLVPLCFKKIILASSAKQLGRSIGGDRDGSIRGGEDFARVS